MNVELFDRIATWLEAGAPHTYPGIHGMTFGMKHLFELPESFSKEDTNWCGTSCCIAGAAITFNAPDLLLTKANISCAVSGKVVAYGVWDEGRDLLGLTEKQASELFAPWEIEDDGDEEEGKLYPHFADIGPAWAARTIRHLITTGEVNWGATEEAEEV